MAHISHKRSKGQSLVGYALVLAIVVTVLVGMNVYVKRGLQGRIRDMTDFIICDRHLTQVSETTSESTTDTTARIKKEELFGGRARLIYLDPETKVQHSESVTVEEQSFSPQPFVPTDGHSETPTHPDEEESGSSGPNN